MRSYYIARRLGRRGAMLTLMGVTYGFLGLGVIMRANQFGPQPFNPLYTLVPPGLQGCLWIATGVVACIFAWVPVPPIRPDVSDKWHDGDGIGWVALYVMPFLRILSYLTSWIAYLILGQGSAIGWYIAALHVPFLLVTLICSGWRENFHAYTTRIR